MYCRWKNFSELNQNGCEIVRATVTPEFYAGPWPVRNARFTLADPMPRLGSDVVGGKSGRNHPTSRRRRRHPIHIIGRMARNAYIRVGWYEGVVRHPGWYGERVLFITTLNCDSRWSPDGSGTHSHWPSRQHRGTIGAWDQLMPALH